MEIRFYEFEILSNLYHMNQTSFKFLVQLYTDLVTKILKVLFEKQKKFIAAQFLYLDNV